MLHRHWADGHDGAAVRAAYADAGVLRSASGAWFVLSCHRILPGVGLKMSPNQVSGRTAFIVKEFRGKAVFQRRSLPKDRDAVGTGGVQSFVEMTEAATQENQPPKLRQSADGQIEASSIADVIEWFLNYDERTARMRHPHTNELFIWKQADDEANAVGTYPFENAEARFAVGTFQAVKENDTEPLLDLWLNDVSAALHAARTAKGEVAESNRLDETSLDSALAKADKLTTNLEKRLYLSSCWIETLCTAEARVLGWIYQELYGKAFVPK